jgi:hypothetical protein
MLYFIQTVSGGPIKIGHSEDVDARIKQLESHYDQPLALLATMPGGEKEERALHQRFSPWRLGRTEQFQPVAELLAFIGRPLLVGPNPNAVEVMEPAVKSLASIKGGAEYATWLEGLAEHAHLPLTILIEHALREYAENHGYTNSQPKR